MIGAVIVWAGILLSSAVLLAGSGVFAELLPILAGGAVWFVLIVPSALRRR